MRYAKLLLPFVAVYLVCANSLRLLAVLDRQPFIPYNQQLEGARILHARGRILRGHYPADRDILFAGTSRTMADVDPGVFAAHLARATRARRTPRAFNLGNAANDLARFARTLNGAGEPGVLILELHPNMFAVPDPRPDSPAGFFGRYRAFETVAELAMAGKLKQITHTYSAARLGPHTLFAIKQSLSARPPSPDPLYFAHLNQYGYGQALQPGGQVHYRRFLAGRAQGRALRPWCSERPAYAAQLAGLQISEPAFAAFDALLRRYGPGGRMLVVRLPVSAQMYTMENAAQGPLYARATALMRRRNVPFIDMNPGDYFTSDESHVDWYDTARLSRDLAARAAPLLAPTPAPR